MARDAITKCTWADVTPIGSWGGRWGTDRGGEPIGSVGGGKGRREVGGTKESLATGTCRAKKKLRAER